MQTLFEVEKKLKIFEHQFKAACQKASIALEPSDLFTGVDKTVSTAPHMATRNLLIFFSQCLRLLKEGGSTAVVSYARTHIANAHYWLDIMEQLLNDKTQPFNPLFYEMMQLADELLTQHFSNENAELSELKLDRVTQLLYQKLARSRIQNYHRLAQDYMQRYNQALHKKRAEIITQYPELRQAQEALATHLTTYANNLPQQINSIEEAFKLVQQINEQLAVWSPLKIQVDTLWQASQKELPVPSRLYSVQSPDVRDSYTELYHQTKELREQHALIECRWNALIEDASKFEAYALQLQQVVMLQALDSVANLHALAPPVLPNAEVPLKVRLQALELLQTTYQKRLQTLSLAKEQLLNCQNQWLETAKNYPSLHTSISAQLQVASQHIERLTLDINITDNQLKGIQVDLAVIAQEYRTLGRKGKLQQKILGLETEQQTLHQELAAATAQLAVINGEELLTNQTVLQELQAREAIFNTQQQDLEAAKGKVNEQLAALTLEFETSSQRCQLLNHLNIPIYKFSAADLNRIASAMNWKIEPTYWSVLVSASKQRLPNIVKVKEARATLSQDIIDHVRAERLLQKKLSANIQAVKQQQHELEEQQAILQLQQQAQRDAMSKYVELLSQARASQEIITEKTTRLQTLQVKITQLHAIIATIEEKERLEAEQEIKRQVECQAIQETLGALMPLGNNLQVQVTHLTKTLDEAIAKRSSHEAVSSLYTNINCELATLAEGFMNQFDAVLHRASAVGLTITTHEHVTAIQSILAAYKATTQQYQQKVHNYRKRECEAFNPVVIKIEKLCDDMNEYLAQRRFFYRLLDWLECPLKYGAKLIGAEYETRYAKEANFISQVSQACQILQRQQNRVACNKVIELLTSSTLNFFAVSTSKKASLVSMAQEVRPILQSYQAG